MTAGPIHSVCNAIVKALGYLAQQEPSAEAPQIIRRYYLSAAADGEPKMFMSVFDQIAAAERADRKLSEERQKVLMPALRRELPEWDWSSRILVRTQRGETPYEPSRTEHTLRIQGLREGLRLEVADTGDSCVTVTLFSDTPPDMALRQAHLWGRFAPLLPKAIQSFLADARKAAEAILRGVSEDLEHA